MATTPGYYFFKPVVMLGYLYLSCYDNFRWLLPVIYNIEQLLLIIWSFSRTYLKLLVIFHPIVLITTQPISNINLFQNTNSWFFVKHTSKIVDTKVYIYILIKESWTENCVTTHGCWQVSVPETWKHDHMQCLSGLLLVVPFVLFRGNGTTFH